MAPDTAENFLTPSAIVPPNCVNGAALFATIELKSLRSNPAMAEYFLTSLIPLDNKAPEPTTTLNAASVLANST